MRPSSRLDAAEDLTEPQAVRQQVSSGLHKIGLAIRHHAWAGGESTGLSPTQGQILVLLLNRGDHETRPGTIAQHLAITQPTASVAIRSLVQKGLIQKQRSSQDARALTLTLTQAGHELAQRSLGWTDFLLAALDELSDDELDVFQRSIVKMIRAMQVREQIPVARMCASCQFFRPHQHPGEPLPHHCAYVDAPFADRHLRTDCPDFQPTPTSEADHLWTTFLHHPPGK